MAEASRIDPTPSTSSTMKKFKKDDKPHTASSDVKQEVESLTVRCFEAIAKITEMLRQGDTTVLEKVLAVVESENSPSRDTKDGCGEAGDTKEPELASTKQHDDSKIDNLPSTSSKRVRLIDEADVLRLSVIGDGCSSVVALGVLKTQHREVALKRAKSSEWNKFIEEEANVLSNLKHKNILRIIAKHRIEPEIVLEFMDLGDLASAVRVVDFSTANLLKLLEDVASAMEYMHGKKYLHRDLAARNVFINRKKQCKLGDFGLAVYVGDCKDGVYHEAVRYINRNISPESLITLDFTVASDVWAMGILCWEVFFLVEHSGTYPLIVELAHKNSLLDKFRLTNKLLKSRQCPETLHAYIVNNLLDLRPSQRPSFTAIKTKLGEIALAIMH